MEEFSPSPVVKTDNDVLNLIPLQVQQPDLGTPGSGDVDDWDDKAALMVKQVAIDDNYDSDDFEDWGENVARMVPLS